ncbi:MAG: class I SAM-dependent methyltransferase [Acidobacteriota bacterium]|nr:class I SAM-dependent methyltransferase [Acidobacteriota bacterium]
MQECLLYSNPELYDLLFPAANGSAAIRDEGRRERIVNSERFYLDEVERSRGSVLELGCGSGRLTIPIARHLAQSAVETVGIDLSQAMLDVARAKAQAAHLAVTFLQGDMRRFALPRRFSTILIPGNSLLHLLTTDDLNACLAAVHRHLDEDGRLVFDISNWDINVLGRDPNRRYPVLHASHPTHGEIEIEETALYDSAEQIRHITWHVSGPGASQKLIQYSLRVIFPQELLLLLDATGFRLESRFGEFTREQFSAGSPRQVCICKAKRC